jgi:Fur family peroxide stress response transcriptional regulator
MKCKRIIDPELSGLQNVTQQLASGTGFKIITHRLDFFGICPDCQNEID